MKHAYLIGSEAAGVDVLATISSVPGEFGDFRSGAIEVDFTGYPNGSLTLLASNKNGPASAFKPVTDSTQAVTRGQASSGGGHLYDIPECGYQFIVVKWTPAAKIVGSAYASAGAGPYVVTVTTVADHPFVSGDVVKFSGGSDAAADGSYAVTKTGDKTFTYSVVGDPGATGTVDIDGATGTIAAKLSIKTPK